MENEKFIDIRPFNDTEAKEAMMRLAKHPLLSPISLYLFPNKQPDQIRQLIASLATVDEFQGKVMFPAINKITF